MMKIKGEESAGPALSRASAGGAVIVPNHPRNDVEDAQGGDVVANSGLDPDVQKRSMQRVVLFTKIMVQSTPELFGCTNLLAHDRVVDRK